MRTWSKTVGIAAVVWGTGMIGWGAEKTEAGEAKAAAESGKASVEKKADDAPAADKKTAVAKTSDTSKNKVKVKKSNGLNMSTDIKEFKPFEANVTLGGGVMGGHMTYQIGKEARLADGTLERMHFPISELKWPMTVAIGEVGGRIAVRRLEAFASYTMSLTDSAGTMEDSDWITSTRYKDIYSESDATLDYWKMDAGLRYWFLSFGQTKTRGHVALGVGFMHQDFQWEASNLDQWYPRRPDLPHDKVDGLVIKYDVTTDMLPYLEVATKMQIQKCWLGGRVGVAPYMKVQDKDSHVLRGKVSELDANGVGWLADVLMQYDITRHIFVQAKAEFSGFKVDDMNQVHFNTPEEGTDHSIYEELESVQIYGTLALGVKY